MCTPILTISSVPSGQARRRSPRPRKSRTKLIFDQATTAVRMLAVLPKSRSMPTYDTEGQFPADFQRITEDQRTQFMAAVYHMVDDLRARRPLRNSLRVRALQGHAGIFD